METLRFYDDNHFYKFLLSAIAIVAVKLEEISKREEMIRTFNKNINDWFTLYEKNVTDKLKVDDMISKIIYMEKYYKIYQKNENKKVPEIQ